MAGLKAANAREAEAGQEQSHGRDEPLVFAVEFTASVRHGRAVHRAAQVGRFADAEDAARGMAAFKEAQGGDSAFAAACSGFMVWLTAHPPEPPREMWLEFDP